MKKSINRLLSTDLILHVPFWVAFVVIVNAGDSNGFGYFTQVRHNILVPLIINAIFNAALTYSIALWLTPRFYESGKWLRYLAVLLGFSLLFLLLKTGVEWLYIAAVLPDLQDVPFTSLVLENVYSLPVFAIGGLAYWAYLKNKKEKEWLVKEKLERELALMKAQMSPHFLFNALNNLYSLGLQGDQKMVTSGILKLSELLRYVLYESQAEKIALHKELRHISDFVEVNKLMLTEEMRSNVLFEQEGDANQLQIPPMILMALVENAFKHGVGNGETDIAIKASIADTTLTLDVRNRVYDVSTERKKSPGGIGLANVRKQLSLLYPDRHQLEIEKQNGYFNVQLHIDLNR